MISPTRLIPIVGMIALLSGCMVGADFVSPDAPSSVSYSRMPLVEQTSSASGPFGEAQRLHAGADVERDWWRHFGSWQLVALVEQALLANHDLEAAEASLRQAWHTYQAQAGSTLYPQ
ncbi:MAG: RND transporter, partial [Chloroflexia bacterium]|nr:RND transporter [Chloroflexia bacterium]